MLKYKIKYLRTIEIINTNIRKIKITRDSEDSFPPTIISS